MEKGDTGAVCTRHRLLVDQLHPLLLQLCQGLLDVRHLQGDVVDPLAAILEELRDRGVILGGLEKLETRFTHREKCHPHLLRLHLVGRRDFESDPVLENGQGFLHVLHSDSDVADLLYHSSLLSLNGSSMSTLSTVPNVCPASRTKA